MSEEVKNNKVPYPVFTGVITIIIIALGWLFVTLAQANDKNESTRNDVGELKVMMAEVKTNVIWIKESIDKSQQTTIKK